MFTLAASASITLGTIYTSNGNTFTVSATSVSSTTLNCYGTGSPGASGTLTFVSGSPSGNKTFNSVVTNAVAKGSTTYEKYLWRRLGSNVFFRWDAKWGAGTAGSGDYAFYFPTNLLPDTTNMQTSIGVIGALTGGTIPTIISSAFFSSSIGTMSSMFVANPAMLKIVLSGNGMYNSGVGGNLGNAVSMSYSGSYPVIGWQP